MSISGFLFLVVPPLPPLPLAWSIDGAKSSLIHDDTSCDPLSSIWMSSWWQVVPLLMLSWLGGRVSLWDEFCDCSSLDRSSSLKKLDLDNNSGWFILYMKWAWIHSSYNLTQPKSNNKMNILYQSTMLDKNTAHSLNHRQIKVLFGFITSYNEEYSYAVDKDSLKSFIL